MWDPYIDATKASEQTQLKRSLKSPFSMIDLTLKPSDHEPLESSSDQRSLNHDLTKILRGLFYSLTSSIMLKHNHFILAMLANFYFW